MENELTPEEQERERQILLSIVNQLIAQETDVTLYVRPSKLSFTHAPPVPFMGIIRELGGHYYASGTGELEGKTFDFDLADILEINISTVPPFCVSFEIKDCK